MGFSPNDPNAARDRANMMMAVVVSLGILLAYHFLVDAPIKKAQQLQEQARQEATGKKPAEVIAGETPVTPAVTAPKTRDEVVAAETEKRIPIKGDKVSGFISTKAARLDDLTLNYQTLHVDGDEHVPVLTPLGADHAKYVESGWMGAQGQTLPGNDTVWTVAPDSTPELTSGGKPVILTWDNGQGLVFERQISLDSNYLFTLKQTIRNSSAAEVKFYTYHAFARKGTPIDYSGFYSLHEGPVYYLNGKHHEISYSGLSKDPDEGANIPQAKGWLGISDKYWMVAILPDPKETFKATILCRANGEPCTGGLHNPPNQHFQADTRSMEMTVAPGKEETETSYVYAGVKNIDVMHEYEEKYGFDHLELGLDFGIYYIITKPFFYLLHFLFKITGHVWMGILLMTIVVRGCIFPLASKSFRSMAKMKVIAPKLKELQETYKDDKAKLQMEIYDLYKKEDANPFSGCWPLLVQIPIFFALYKVILISVELRHAPFPGWIRDLSAADPTSIFNLFGLINWHPPQFLMIGAWPCLFLVTMVLQKRITPPMSDPVQERLQTYFPFIATLMMSQFASGLIIYWTWSNTLSFFQQYYILRKFGGEDTSLLLGHAERRKKKKPKDLP